MGKTERKKDGQDFTVNLDETSWRRLKYLSAEQKRPMSEIVRESIRNHLDLAQVPVLQ